MDNSSVTHELPNSFPTQLKEQGFLLVENVLEENLVQELRKVAEALVLQQTDSELESVRSLGSLIRTWVRPEFVQLIAHHKIMEFFRHSGCLSPRFSNGYIFCKPPNSPATYWHQDWWLWQHPLSYTPFVHQLGFMYYLDDTSVENGCLRVIPGSHRKAHGFHELLKNKDRNSLRLGDCLEDPLYNSDQDELALPMNVGDLLVIDARLLHGAYPNNSTARRTVVTLWYFPFYDRLDEKTQATIEEPRLPSEWPQEIQAQLRPLLPHYDGNEKPLPFALHPLENLR